MPHLLGASDHLVDGRCPVIAFVEDVECCNMSTLVVVFDLDLAEVAIGLRL